MTIAINHAFISLKGDGTDSTQVQPSNWNAGHNLTLATGNLVGRLSAGNGAAEEIPITAYMANLLTAADGPTLAGLIGLFTTGDVKYTFSGTASAGWVLITGTNMTIGNASSGASLRANADTQNLFTLLYNQCSDTLAPVSGGRTGNATNDFNANKTITIPGLIGRVPVGAGAAQSWSTLKTLGTGGGEETHTLTVAELAVHFHGAPMYDPGHSHATSAIAGTTTTGGGGFNCGGTNAAGISTATTGVRIHGANGFDYTDSAGSGNAHNNMQPYMPLNVMVKL